MKKRFQQPTIELVCTQVVTMMALSLRNDDALVDESQNGGNGDNDSRHQEFPWIAEDDF